MSMWFETRKINPRLIWEAKEQYKNFDGLITEGFKLEAEGRRLASEREGIIGNEDLEWVEKLESWHRNMYDVVTVMSEICVDYEHVDDTDDLHEALDVGVIVTHCFYCLLDSYLMSTKRSEALKHTLEYSSTEDIDTFLWLMDELKIYDEEQRNLTHRKGIWLYGSIPDEKYSYAAFVNDLTSVFHQLLNYLMRRYQKLVVIVPERVYSIGVGNPYLEKLATNWWNSVEYLNKRRLYYPNDYVELCVFVKSSEAEIRVGSSEGHVTHVEFRLRGIVADYYDTDEDVNRVFMRLSEYYGCRVVEHSPKEYTKIFCPSLNGSDLKFMKAVLPFVTSMDFRIGDSEIYWRDWSGYAELSKKYSYEDLELQLCLIAGKELLER